MHKDFWLERWASEKIGFHQDAVHPYLSDYWHDLQLTGRGQDTQVFVPLCGKSHDMQWLRQQGHPVLGVELSDIAVRAFYRENGYLPQQFPHEKFVCYEADNIRILCGDFFDMGKDDLANVPVVYDRASLIALPPEMRERYARHLVSILPPAAQILLITLEYPQAQMPGPPFSVSAEEVAALYQPHAEIRLLATLDVLSQNPRFENRGLRQLQENIYLLTLRSPR